MLRFWYGILYIFITFCYLIYQLFKPSTLEPSHVIRAKVELITWQVSIWMQSWEFKGHQKLQVDVFSLLIFAPETQNYHWET